MHSIMFYTVKRYSIINSKLKAKLHLFGWQMILVIYYNSFHELKYFS